MASKRKNIFTRNKPLINIYSKVDYQGKQIEVREDAEQLVKWHEISDALVAAGYYRAQLQGLSAFDKIVGGLSWCIELCDIDVDVSLLFEENLTIGKKIALTEKIVKVLPSVKCPFIVEPHQIQGLDFINIHPLIQWLIKYSSEFRIVKEEELRKFAVLQYDRDHIFESDRVIFYGKEKLLKNLAVIQNLYNPSRIRKRKGGFPNNELEQVNATLAEYDQRLVMNVATSAESADRDEGLDAIYDSEKTLADPTDVTIESAVRGAPSAAHAAHAARAGWHYAALHAQLAPGDERAASEQQLARAERALAAAERRVRELRAARAAGGAGERAGEALRSLTARLLQRADASEKDVKEFYKSVKQLATERLQLAAVARQRTNELNRAQAELSTMKNPETAVTEDPLTEQEQKEFVEKKNKMKGYITDVRLELGKLNREVQRYSVAVDELPGASELLQYEKRFVELYDQVAAKHKETKQYYIFYNTLYEVKLYTSKELSLLNSIIDNYEEAMSSPRKREEFMTQFESIVEWVNQTVKKVEQKFNQDKVKKAGVHSEHSRLMDVRRQYAAALSQLAASRRARCA